VTVGPGIAPGLLTPGPQGQPRALAGSRRVPGQARCAADTAGGDFHPALRTLVAGLPKGFPAPAV